MVCAIRACVICVFVLQTPSNDNPLAQQKTLTTTPSSSPAIKKPVRKAPPPPLIANKTPQSATQANGDTIGECKQVESDLPPTFKEIKHNIAETLSHQLQLQQQEEQPLPLKQQYQQQKPGNVRCLSKSSSCSEIVNSQGRKGPPLPVRDSSLSAESYSECNDDKGDARGFGSQDPKQARAGKPVPKRRTKSVHH